MTTSSLTPLHLQFLFVDTTVTPEQTFTVAALNVLCFVGGSHSYACVHYETFSDDIYVCRKCFKAILLM